MSGIALTLAFLLDLLLGDPPTWPHPVIFIGRAIAFLDGFSRKVCERPIMLKIAGVCITLLVVGLTYLIVAALLCLAQKVWPGFGWVLAVVLAYSAIAARGLYDQTWRVVVALQNGDLPGARRLLGMVVGRETDQLDERQVLRAVIETIAENLSDGVIAPIFYLAIGGPALGWAYKAVNTLDSMIGYKSDKYRDLGWASAKLDDLANLIPARLTAVLIGLAAFMLNLDGPGAFKTWWTHGHRHTSPNAGRPEAALAGALGIRLGGANIYHGEIVEKPEIGYGTSELTATHARRAENVLLLSSLIMVLFVLSLGAF
jgi:adenosylcobinamide-phosphate synthase